MTEVDLGVETRLRLQYKNVFDKGSRIFITFDHTQIWRHGEGFKYLSIALCTTSHTWLCVPQGEA